MQHILFILPSPFTRVHMDPFNGLEFNDLRFFPKNKWGPIGLIGHLAWGSRKGVL
jgi:hypothetical protein